MSHNPSVADASWPLACRWVRIGIMYGRLGLIQRFNWSVCSSMQPRVTIIIPTFNRAHLVPRAIDSVLRQTHSNVGVIVVDDGSTDNTVAVLGAYKSDTRVRVVELPQNRGANAAINAGLDELTDETAFFG